MTWPRYVPIKSYCFVTRRCAQRKFLLKPSKATNRAFEYCLAWAAHKTGVQVLFAVVLSNHYHLGLYDPKGRVSEFMRELNRLVAKHHNVMYRRRENLFSTDKFSKVLLESAIDVVRRLIYTLDNPVKAGLVDAARHWPGVISLPKHLASTKTVKRPPLFFREDGDMPKTLKLTYHKPDLFERLDDDTYRDWVARMLETREALRRRQREESGRKVLGRRAVLAQHHDDSASSHEAPFQPNPRVGAADKWRRIEAIQRLVVFLKEYAECWRRWKAGNREVVFPYGTYAMRVVYGARCAQAPPAPA